MMRINKSKICSAILLKIFFHILDIIDNAAINIEIGTFSYHVLG